MGVGGREEEVKEIPHDRGGKAQGAKWREGFEGRLTWPDHMAFANHTERQCFPEGWGSLQQVQYLGFKNYF